ncbi:VanZ family protein [Anaerocolumna xylanovorans]|uniref:VanZ like family protein n=1 Tax=Anaerocolumna xylanovorans DSM 12503 TaxID=1121345 RepID=A0A1M7Y492_9FIRM|nr:VanZ family protein [Anaerocolumna xylanovorans]SHO46924.1 VanZ like family protein [Anaerocolumna xylanovorans DSM 12503]
MLQIQAYLLPGFAASILFLIVSEIGYRIRRERITWFHRLLVLSTGLYITAVFAVTLSPGSAISFPPSFRNFNLTPFQALHTASSNPLNFWGNIALFIPLGIFLVLLFNHCQKFLFTLLTGAGISLLIELLQLFGIRAADIDDILLNTAGTILGYLSGKILVSFVPFCRRNSGVFKHKDTKIVRKRQDAGSFFVLVVFILVTVFLTGYVRTDGTFNPPFNPEKAVQYLNPEPKIQETRKISVSIDAKNAYLWDTTTNTVLYDKESSKPIAPASTTKMLTALTVLDYCDENDTVLIGKEVGLIAADASRAWLYPGDKLTIRQLFDALLLPSGNDAAYALAVFAGKKICRDDTVSIDKALRVFLKAMNEKAAMVGATHSHFINPDGYDADGQYTTAKDLALIAREFLESETLRGIAGNPQITDTWLSGQEVTYSNTNELINPESPYYYEFAAGLKTGSSENAGCCLVSCAYIEKGSYICVVMGSTKEGRWQDSIKLYNSIQQ